MALRYSVLQLRKLKPEETQATPVIMTRVCPTLLLACHLPSVLPGKRMAFSGWGWRGHYPAPRRAHLGSTPLQCEFIEPRDSRGLCSLCRSLRGSWWLWFIIWQGTLRSSKSKGHRHRLQFKIQPREGCFEERRTQCFLGNFLFFVALGIEKWLIICSSVVWMFLVQKWITALHS